MPRKPSPEGPKWSFYIERDAVYKHQYVKASYCKWDVEKQQPRTAARVHVGRLLDDGSIRPGKTFLEKFPEYQGKELYYFENKLLDREGYIKVNPDALEQWDQAANEPEEQAKTKQELLEEDWRAVSRQCGPTYAAWMHVRQSGMLADLEAAFGKEDAKLLAALAVYRICVPGGAMENFSTWLGGVYLADVIPVSGQRISELLSRVVRGKVDQFFKARFNSVLVKARKERQERAKKDPKALNEPLTIAFDSTGISTHSETIEEVEYGKAKADPELKQVNLTFACDQKTGEVLYAREYEGSINDVASFSSIFADMKEVGFHVEDVEIVTDRGYKAPYNIQAQLDAGVKFVQGLRIDEKSINDKFDRHMGELRGNANYLPDWGYATLTLPKEEDEVWQKRSKLGQLTVRVHTHLYYSDDLALRAKKTLLSNVDDIVKDKNAGKQVKAETWSKYGGCVANVGTKDEPKWVRNLQEINKRLRYAGCFAIRTNSRHDPIEALSVYRKRAKIEAQYRIFKNDIEGDRMNATQTSYAGKLFVFTLATSLRSRMGTTMRTVAQAKNAKVPNNSLDTVLMELAKVTLRRRGESLLWRPDMFTKKQREYFALLDVIPPKGIFRN